MSQILVIADDPLTRTATERILDHAGHSVLTAQSALDGLRLLQTERPMVVITALRLPDASGLDVLRAMRQARSDVPVIVVTEYGRVRDAVEATRNGAADVIEQPIREEQVIEAVDRAIAAAPECQPLPSAGVDARECEAHAAARWARCVARIITYPKDPRTLANWSHWLYASEGALRNWCWAAGISPRRSLVFGRLLRAVCRNDGGRVRLRNLLDVVDRRTVTNLLQYAGFDDEHSFPHDIAAFLDRQQLVRDPEMIAEIKKVLVTSLLVPASAAATEDYDGASKQTRHATAADFQRDL